MKRCLLTVMAIVVAFLPLAVSAEPGVPPWRQEFPEGREQTTITVGDTALTVDLALTPPQQQLGLGYRNDLEPGTGMLFVFDSANQRTFWMKGMRFCLDIIWIENGQIVGAAENACPDPEGTADMDRARFPSGEPVTYVLEVPAGWLKSHGYGSGTPVELDELPAGN